VLREEGFGTRETLRQALGGLWRDHVHLELPSTTAVKEAVEVGAGAGVLSALTTARDLREGRMVRVPVADLELTRRLCAVWGKESEPSPAATALLELAVNAQGSAAGTMWRAARGHQLRYREVRPLPSSQRQATMARASAS
jgi:DNA-binding transcriptional LysR family regulator